MHSHRSFFDSLIVVLLLALISDSVGAQITIREKINIVPQSHRSHTLGGGDSTLIITTPVAGTLHIGGAGAFNCLYSHYHILSPIDYILCGGTPLVVPGNWKAGTVVQAKLVTYPGYPYRDEFFPSAITHTYDPEYQLHDYRMDFPDFDIDNWSLHATVYPGTDFDHFRVQFDPDTIAYGDTTKIVVTAVDAGNQEVDLDGSTQMTFTLDSARYGSFIRPSGSLSSSPLSGVLYSDAKAGHVKFFANGARDTVALKSLQCRVEGADTSGEGTIKVGPMKIVILEKEPRRLWPFISTNRAGADCPGYNPKRSYTVEIRHPRRRSMQGKAINVEARYTARTGGHVHSNPPPLPPPQIAIPDTIMVDSLRGIFWCQGVQGNPLTNLLANASSQVVIDSFRTSPFSGSFSIFAVLSADTSVYDSVSLTVRVDSIVQFHAGSNWVLTGVPGDSGYGENHPQNHYCSPMVRDSVTAALHKFEDFCESSKHKGARIISVGVNDMSLDWGGAFDVRGKWALNRHKGHRIGSGVDVDRTSANTPRVSLKVGRLLTDEGKALEKCMQSFGGHIVEEPTIHFEFDRRTR